MWSHKVELSTLDRCASHLNLSLVQDLCQQYLYITSGKPSFVRVAFGVRRDGVDNILEGRFVMIKQAVPVTSSLSVFRNGKRITKLFLYLPPIRVGK